MTKRRVYDLQGHDTEATPDGAFVLWDDSRGGRQHLPAGRYNDRLTLSVREAPCLDGYKF